MSTISKNDEQELKLFTEYLDDLRDMPPAEFAAKWYVYVGMSRADAEKYCTWRRNQIYMNNPKESRT